MRPLGPEGDADDPFERWRAAVGGGPDHRVDGAASAPPVGAPLSPPEVALCVDRGRELAARAGRGVLRLRGGGTDASALRAWLAGPADGGPLGALRRLGDGPLCLLAGAALGAGEHGLGVVCEDDAARAAAELACRVEPDLRPRVWAR